MQHVREKADSDSDEEEEEEEANEEEEEEQEAIEDDDDIDINSAIVDDDELCTNSTMSVDSDNGDNRTSRRCGGGSGDRGGVSGNSSGKKRAISNISTTSSISSEKIGASERMTILPRSSYGEQRPTGTSAGAPTRMPGCKCLIFAQHK